MISLCKKETCALRFLFFSRNFGHFPAIAFRFFFGGFISLLCPNWLRKRKSNQKKRRRIEPLAYLRTDLSVPHFTWPSISPLAFPLSPRIFRLAIGRSSLPSRQLAANQETTCNVPWFLVLISRPLASSSPSLFFILSFSLSLSHFFGEKKKRTFLLLRFVLFTCLSISLWSRIQFSCRTRYGFHGRRPRVEERDRGRAKKNTDTHTHTHTDAKKRKKKVIRRRS